MPDRDSSFHVAPPSALACLARAAACQDDPGAPAAGWPVQGRGSNWGGMPAASIACGNRASPWVEEAFGCAEWSAAANDPGMFARIVCDGPQGQVGHCELDSLRIRRGAAPEGAASRAPVYLWFIERGTLQLRLDDGRELHYGSGDLLLTDGAQPLRALWQGASVHHLSLPRHRIDEAVGPEGTPGLQGVMVLNRFGLSSFLVAQLRLLQRQGPGLAAVELAETLSVIFGTVDSLLRLALPAPSAARPSVAVDRLQAVYRYIEKNLHRQDLTVAQIALGVNSSRAQVYRLFQAQPLTVHGALREARLRKSMAYLQRGEDAPLSIGAIAYACGFSDQSAFSKLFRQRFGLKPSEVRSAHARHRMGTAARTEEVVGA